MVCPTCHGTGSQRFERLGDFPAFSTRCYECQGSGIVSCCDTAGATYSMVGMFEEAPFTRPEDYWHGVDNET